MSRAVAIQDSSATVPAKTIDQLVLEGSTELIAARSIAAINMALERFGVDGYRVPAEDDRLNDVAAALAAANHTEMQIAEELAILQQSLAVLDQRFAERTARMDVILANRRPADLSPNEALEFASLRCECDAITATLTDTRAALTLLDMGASAADVARCTTDLNRAEHSILSEILAGHVNRAERALLSAVAALREVTRIGVKHLGPGVGGDYAPGAGMVALLAC
ncbi:hypothetical protein R69619_00391 [Paraburkholderia nemoris]|uniref:hypothetical protein n=1 Tax=Paraburkholderia nemoris TaxID=2793076 RepID=UPI00190A5DAC|nr:hypothetical protein [Paraburkholderia nemoris]MBK3737656.1 hypothetical protein [Paraburkholderia aspalathi]CAE6694088.1 hypothetical protein R69619_00391 [Paraburkholderia nemoris]